MSNEKECGTCQECVWYSIEDASVFCDDIRSKGMNTCTRFYYNSIKNDKLCPRCKRDKDPGKCWWCEYE